MRHARRLGIAPGFTEKMAQVIIDEYKHVYPELDQNRERVFQELLAEETRFGKTLDEGKREFDKTVAGIRRKNEFMGAKDPAYVPDTQISGKQAFRLYDTYGYPLEMTQELAREAGFTVDVAGYQECFKAHQELSRANVGSAKSGLAEHSEETTALHTATHLLHKALKIVLGDHCNQKGSNITAERLRLDFTHGEKMTPEQIQKVEDLVNEQIKADLPVYRDMNASNMYWEGIAEEVKYFEEMFGFDPDKAGSDMNNAFLEANGQEGGTETYIVPDNVYVDFYTAYVE